SSEGGAAGFCFRALPLTFFATTATGLVSSIRTESTQATKRTWAIESAACRALRRLSVRARSAAAWASAALAFLFPTNGRLSSLEQPDRATAARKASPTTLRATGLSFRRGGLHEGPDLELGL